MDPNIITAYDSLVPRDQLVIDTMISALSTKDKQIRDLVAHILDKDDSTAEKVNHAE